MPIEYINLIVTLGVPVAIVTLNWLLGLIYQVEYDPGPDMITMFILADAAVAFGATDLSRFIGHEVVKENLRLYSWAGFVLGLFAILANFWCRGRIASALLSNNDSPDHWLNDLLPMLPTVPIFLYVGPHIYIMQLH